MVFFIFLPVFTDHRPLFRSLSWESKLCPELECKEIISNSKLQRLVIASFSGPVFPCEIKVSSFPALLILLCRACFVMKKMESCLSWTDDNIPLDEVVSSNAFFSWSAYGLTNLRIFLSRKSQKCSLSSTFISSCFLGLKAFLLILITVSLPFQLFCNKRFTVTATRNLFTLSLTQVNNRIYYVNIKPQLLQLY